MKIPLPNFNLKQPTTIQDLEEVTISLFSSNFEMYAVNSKILYEKQIIPQDWVLTQEKLINPKLIQFMFKNGFKIQTQVGKIDFSTSINHHQIPIPKIINNFIYALPQFTYHRLQIMPKRLICLPGKINVAQNFILENILHKGYWQNFNNVKPQAQLTFIYDLNNSYLTLKINDVKFKQSKKQIKPALFFRGIFNENLQDKSKVETLKKLDLILQKYDQYLNTFNQVVNNFFSD